MSSARSPATSSWWQLVHEAALGCAARAHLLRERNRYIANSFAASIPRGVLPRDPRLALEVGVHPGEDLVGVLERQAEDRAHDARRDVAAELDHRVGAAALAHRASASRANARSRGSSAATAPGLNAG
jgi:hypothetical protein